MKNRAICAEGWLSKDDLVSRQSFVSLLYSKSRERLFFSDGFCACSHTVWLYVCKHRCMRTRGEGGFLFPLWLCCTVTYLRVCVYLVLGRKRLPVLGLWSHQPVKVKSDSERDKADWHGNGICCLCAKRPDWLTALSLSSHPSLSSHRAVHSSSHRSRLCIPISE